MAENYKLLYEQMKKVVTTYQDEIAPGLRKIIEELEKNQIKVRCAQCENWDTRGCSEDQGWCKIEAGYRKGDWYCASGERKSDGNET